MLAVNESHNPLDTLFVGFLKKQQRGEGMYLQGAKQTILQYPTMQKWNQHKNEMINSGSCPIVPIWLFLQVLWFYFEEVQLSSRCCPVLQYWKHLLAKTLTSIVSFGFHA